MNEIPFDKIGIIRGSKHSKEIGWYITVQDDTRMSGGYKIFTSNNSEFENGYPEPIKIVFDGWVEKKEHIPKYFEEAKYDIEWTLDQITIKWADDMKSWKWQTR
jgi:hypothetical protein